MNSGRKRKKNPTVLIGPPADTAWIRYLTGFEAPDPVGVVYTAERLDVLVSPLEVGRANRPRKSRCPVHIHTAESLGIQRVSSADPFQALLRLLQRRGIRAIRVSPRFPVQAARRIEAGNISVRVETGALFPERERKTEQEIGYIRLAQKAAVRAMREAILLIRTAAIDRRGYLRYGTRRLTSEAVRSRIARVLFDAGCREEGTIVASGRQAADPHERGHGPLRAGRAIVLDIFPRHEESGYWGDLTRTVIRGAVPDRLGAMYEAVAAAHRSALKRLAPRVAVRSVHAAAQEVFEQRGFRTVLDTEKPEGFIHGTGHGVGLEIHEAPSLRAGPGRVRSGHVVTVEPGLYYRDLGGIRIEDTVAVTPDGAKILAPLSRRFRLDA